MQPIVTYLEDTEKKVVKEMAELFSKMREQQNTMAIDGIADMYSSTPIEGVLYEPCVRIPSSHGGHYYCSEYKLPKDEYVIFVNKTSCQVPQHVTGCSYGTVTCNHTCIALTNYGRCFLPKPIVTKYPSEYGSYSLTSDNNYIQMYEQGYARNVTPIIKLDPFPYKIPKQLFDTFLLAFKLGNQSLSASDTTSALQELNKEFYLFAGKWQPHMTEHVTLDVDSMRQTIIENTQTIQDLSGKNKTLEEQNASLQAELTLLKEQKAALEKEKARLLPMEKYKETVITFMDEHYTGGKPYDRDNISDIDIIKYFNDWHFNKVFMNEWEYDDVIESKEELQEYRIYKKVKGEMVSNGMDNSSVARNVSSIKHNVKKLNKK